jgi:L-aminopeptidase/D-esterase-like protein
MRLLPLAIAVALAAIVQSGPPSRPRARDLGIAPGTFPTGPLNAITDVGGVTVGQTTIVEGDTVRTGVTAILPHGRNLFQEKVPGAVFVGNAFGKLAGSTQVNELGTIETPVVLTNTLSVGTAVEAVVRWTLAQPGNEQVRSVNALVGETNDGTCARRFAPRRAVRLTKAPWAPVQARSRSAGREASAPRLASFGRGRTRGPSASSCRAIMVDASWSTGSPCGAS